MPSKKSWREKLADSMDLPKIQKVEGHKVVSKGKSSWSKITRRLL